MRSTINADGYNNNDATAGTPGYSMRDVYALTDDVKFKNRFDLHYQEMDTEFGVDCGDTNS